MTDQKKPELHLTKVEQETIASDLARLFKKLTGRDPTQEELDEGNQMIAEYKKPSPKS